VAFTVYVKAHLSVGCWGELGLSTIGNRQAFVWQETGFNQMGMSKFDEQILDVSGHTDATPAS
jgi:hypothetical protein